jgi:anti-sigma regulatory factor (Ser/Thr protein kinase)
MDLEPLVLPGKVAAQGELSAYILKAAACAGLDKESAYRLRLAVDEIAANAILHGYQETGEEGDIRVCGEITAEQLVIVLEDDSPAYNPLDTPPPADLKRPPQTRKVGGLGVYLALQGVDAFHYEWRQGTNRNHFTMVCRDPGLPRE